MRLDHFCRSWTMLFIVFKIGQLCNKACRVRRFQSPHVFGDDRVMSSDAVSNLTVTAVVCADVEAEDNCAICLRSLGFASPFSFFKWITIWPFDVSWCIKRECFQLRCVYSRHRSIIVGNLASRFFIWNVCQIIAAWCHVVFPSCQTSLPAKNAVWTMIGFTPHRAVTWILVACKPCFR